MDASTCCANSSRYLSPGSVDSIGDAEYSRSGISSSNNRLMSDGGIDKKGAQSVSPSQSIETVRTNGTEATGVNKHIIAKTLKAKFSQDSTVLVSESEFRDGAMKAGLPPKVRDELVNSVYAYVRSLPKISVDEKREVDGLKQGKRGDEKFGTDTSWHRQAKTVVSAGTASYMTSLMFGKLLTNIFMVGLGQPHNGWTFLVAGLLNAIVSEPVVQGIRRSGAVYASPDGKAYTDYHTAQQWLKKAVRNKDAAGEQRWRAVMANIVDNVIKRETSKGIKVLGSGIREIRRDGSGKPVSATTVGNRSMDGQQAEEQVIAAAKRRAYLTDDLPHFSLLVNSTISGAVAPLLRSVLPLWGFVLSDLAIGAAVGTLCGVQTAALQNILRAYVQGAPLDARPPGHRQKQLRTARAVEQVWEDRAARLREGRIALKLFHSALRSRSNVASRDHKPVSRELTEAQADIKVHLAKMKKEYKSALRKLREVRQEYNTSNSRFERVEQSIKTSMASYMGEADSIPSPMGGLRAQYRMYSKLLTYPLALAPFVAWIAYAIPGIVAAAFPTATNATGGLNHTSLHGLNDSLAGLAPAMQGDPGFETAKMSLQMGLGAFSGLPLIIGLTMRLQYCSQWAESAIVSALDGGYAARECRRPEAQENDDDEVISVSNTDSEASLNGLSEATESDADFESESEQSSGKSPTAYTSSDESKGDVSDKVILKSARVAGGASEDDGYSTAQERSQSSSDDEASESSVRV